MHQDLPSHTDSYSAHEDLLKLNVLSIVAIYQNTHSLTFTHSLIFGIFNVKLQAMESPFSSDYLGFLL